MNKVVRMDRIKFCELLDYEQPQKYIVPNELYDENGEYPVLTAGKSFILGRTNDYNEVYNTLPTIIFDDFTCDCKYVDFPFVVKSSAMKMLTPKNETVDLKFCYYYMKYIDYKISEHKRHWISIYSQISIKKYDLPTQQKIVEELDCLSDIIEKKKKQLSDFDELIKSKFVEMFGHYNKKELRDFVTFFSGYAFKSQLFQDYGIPIIRISNIQNGEIDLNVVYYPESEVAGLEKYKLQFNDILIAMSGATTGKVGLFKEKRKFLLNQRVGCIRPIIGKSTSNFLFVYLNSERIQSEILEISAGCAQPNISGAQILSIQIPDVPLNEQILFNEFVQLIDKSKLELKQSIEETQNLFNERMQYYFGE